MKHFIKYLFLLIFLCKYLFAQNISFKNYTINDGISQSVVKCVLQDSDGYIWFGTQDGLNKFDGYTFEKFIHNPFDTNTISNNWIYSIVEDKNGYIWVGTRSGFNKYDKKINKFKRYTSTLTKEIYGMAVNIHNFIVVNNPPYISIFNSDKEKFTHYKMPVLFDGAIQDEAFPLLIDKNGLIWVGINAGLLKFNPLSRKFELFSHQIKNAKSLSNNFITEIYEDSKGNLWIGTKDGLNLFNKSDKTFKVFNQSSGLNDAFIRSIVEDNNGFYWIATEHGGINKLKFDKQFCKVIQCQYYKNQNGNPNSIGHDNVLSLYIDKSNVLWAGTLQGLSKADLKNKKFNVYRKTDDINSLNLSENVVSSIYKNEDGTLWIGNWTKGLNLVDRITGNVKHFSSSKKGNYYLPNDFVHSIIKDKNGKLWVGTRGGVFVYNKLKNQFEPYTVIFKNPNPPDFSNIRVFQIYEDSSSNIWVATANGLYLLNMSNGTFRLFVCNNTNDISISDNLVYSVIEDKNNFIWAGTTNGLNKVDLKNNVIRKYFRSLDSENSLCDNFIVSLCVDYQNNLWIGTKNGVNKFNIKDSIFTYFSVEKNNLPGNTVYEILEDNNKTLWFATGKGLARFSPENKGFIKYSEDDGLQGLEFNLKASHKSKDGEVFFGGMNGFNSFYPDSLVVNSFVPQIVITAINKLQNNEKIRVYPNEKNVIELSYNDYEFTIEFAALEFSNPEKNFYKYLMEGLCDDWVDLGNRRFVTFTKLPHGVYNFKVIGANNDGVWNKTGTSLQIIINPPWWKTSWAIIVFIIIGILIVFSFIRLREYRLKRERKILKRRVLERTKEIEQKNHELQQQKEELMQQAEELYKYQNHLEDLVLNRTKLLGEAKEKAEESEKKFRLLIHALGEGVVIVNEQEEFVFSNPAAENIFQVAENQLIGKNLFDYLGNEEIQKVKLESKKREEGLTSVYELKMNVDVDKFKYLLVTSSPYNVETIDFKGALVVIRDITEHKKALQLENDVLLAQKTAEVRQHFLASISHEMRTPMNGIMGMTDFLLDTNLDDTQKEYVNTIKNSSESLLSIINDVLNLSKIEQGKMIVVPEPLNVEFFIRKIIDVFKILANQKNIIITYIIEPNFPKIILVDHNHFRQILYNLISNAVKYTIKGEIKVVFSVVNKEQKDIKIKIIVEDTGIGIADKHINSIFDAFTRVEDDKYTRSIEGTGLGLNITKRLVDLIGGEIGVSSHVNVGSKFWFTFITPIMNGEVLNIESIENHEHHNFNLKVLMAEDKKVNQMVAKLLLEKNGCIVSIANNGKELLDIFEMEKFDLILMDIIMPEMDGIEAMKQLRKRYSLLPPIIALSAHAMEGDSQNFVNIGMDDYLEKPINKEKLFTILNKWTKNKEK